MAQTSHSATHPNYKEHKMFVDDLSLGMFIIALDKPWEESDFLFQGFMITNTDELLALQQQCQFVYIRKSLNKNTNTETFIHKIRLNDDMAHARSAYQSACSNTKVIFDTLRFSENLDVNKVNHVVDDIVDGILKDEAAMLLLSQIKNRDEYTSEHSLRVALFSGALAKEIGLKPLEIKNVTVCGLLHDVGKIQVPLDILNKPGKFTDAEYTIMKAHTTYGRKMLIGQSGFYEGAVDVAYSHHERLDGQGYPRGVDSSQIPYFAKIVAVADTYDAITSDRCYKEGLSSLKAFEILHNNCDTCYEKNLVEHFIKLMGVYAPGCIVELNTGDIGIVISTNKTKRLLPKVLILRNKEGFYKQQRMFDLYTLENKESNEYKVKEAYADGSFDIKLSDFLTQGLQIEFGSKAKQSL